MIGRGIWKGHYHDYGEGILEYVPICFKTKITCLFLGCPEFECPNGKCILYKDLCDGYNDCPSGGDEEAFVCVDTGNFSDGNIINEEEKNGLCKFLK